MTEHKKQAVDLVNKFYFKLSNNGSLDIGLNNCTQRLKEAKECALIAVDELIKDNLHNENIVNGGLNAVYWQYVKQLIEKL